MKEYLKLFWAFLKVGALTFGGGYAMLPILQRDIVEHYGWASEEEVMDYYAMGQCLPGIIMVNTSVFIGQKHRGTLGGIVAGFASTVPSLIIITVIAAFLTRFAEYPVVQHFTGIESLRAILPAAGGVILVLISMVLTFLAGLIPSRFAAKRDPVEALRTE